MTQYVLISSKFDFGLCKLYIYIVIYTVEKMFMFRIHYIQHYIVIITTNIYVKIGQNPRRLFSDRIL